MQTLIRNSYPTSSRNYSSHCDEGYAHDGSYTSVDQLWLYVDSATLYMCVGYDDANGTPLLWNALPFNLRTYDSFPQCKRQLETYLNLRDAYS